MNRYKQWIFLMGRAFYLNHQGYTFEDAKLWLYEAACRFQGPDLDARRFADDHCCQFFDSVALG